MKTLRLVQIVTAALVLKSSVLGAEGRKPSVSVAATESQLPIWQPAMGEGLAQMMLTELTRLPNIQVLESVALDDLREERTLGESGEIDRTERIRKGNWKAADYTFKTIITRFGADETQSGGGVVLPIPVIRGLPSVGGIRIDRSTHEVQIDWRVIDNTTRAVVKSGRGTGTEKGKSFSFTGFGSGGFRDSREFAGSALGKATMKAIASIVTELEEWTPPVRSGRDEIADRKAAETSAAELGKRDAQRRIKGEVLLVDGEDVWLALGANRGFLKGDHVTVYRKLEKKNKAGVVVVTDYEPVCELELTKVQPEKSCGRKLQAAKVEEGSVAALTSVDIARLD